MANKYGIYEGEPGTEDKLKCFRIPATWQVTGYLYVKAKSLESAIEKVEDNKSDETATKSFKGVEYVDDTFEIDEKECSFEYYCGPGEKETPRHGW